MGVEDALTHSIMQEENVEDLPFWPRRVAMPDVEQASRMGQG